MGAVATAAATIDTNLGTINTDLGTFLASVKTQQASVVSATRPDGYHRLQAACAPILAWMVSKPSIAQVFASAGRFDIIARFAPGGGIALNNNAVQPVNAYPGTGVNTATLTADITTLNTSLGTFWSAVATANFNATTWQTPDGLNILQAPGTSIMRVMLSYANFRTLFESCDLHDVNMLFGESGNQTGGQPTLASLFAPV